MIMMMMMDTATAVRFPSSSGFCPSSTLSHYRPSLNVEEVSGVHVASRRLVRSGTYDASWKKFGRLNAVSALRRSNISKNRIRATAEHLGSASDPSKQNSKLRYHPFEDIAEKSSETNEDPRLTAQETARTVVEVNRKATLMLTDLIDDDIHENIIWPDLPYVTDEHGNIYFQVKNEEDILQTLTSENNFVQVIIGFDTTELVGEMELLGPSEIDFGIDEIESVGSDIEDDEEDDDEDDDYDKDLVAVLDDEDEDEDDEDDLDETLGDWAKLETMRSSHPMYFAKKLAQVVSDDPIDWMDQPPAGLAIQGIIRPAFIEEHSDIRRHISRNQYRHADINHNTEKLDNKLEHHGGINGHQLELGSSDDGLIPKEEPEKDEILINGTSFYKLEMIKIQLISAHGHHTVIEVEDFRKAQPDAISLLAPKIISHIKAGGEKMTQALKSLCWRCKSIQVEEAALIGVDSLGFDLRVCCGTQIQTLRFAFNSRAASEYSAEGQLNDMLFPRPHHRQSKKKHSSK